MTCARSGPIHGSGVRPALWNAQSYVGDAGARGHARGGLRDLVGVAVAGLDDADRQRVRREDDRLVGLRLRRAHALGERVEQQRMGVEGFDRLELHAGGQRRVGGVDVLLDAQRGELRRHRDADDARDAGRRQLARARP